MFIWFKIKSGYVYLKNVNRCGYIILSNSILCFNDKIYNSIRKYVYLKCYKIRKRVRF